MGGADVIWAEKEFKKAGLPVGVFEGAYDRGHGDLINDIPFWHHTGSFGETPRGIALHPSLGLASQFHLSRTGFITICGVGVAWHAGTGSGFGLPKNNGNMYSAGIEAAHDGVGVWSKEQLNNYLEMTRVMNIYRGRPRNTVVAHKEYGAIQGKWDPGNMDMKWVRQVLLQGKPAQAVVINMIELEAKENPWVGKRLAQPGSSGEMSIGRDFKGRMVAYENAHIYFHPSTGAHAIPHGGLFEAYMDYKFERGVLGYPVRDYTKLPQGAVMSFQGGVLYKKDNSPAHIVKGIIGQRWAVEGYEKGPLGWPTSDEIPNGTGGVYQTFEHGSLEWDRSGAIKHLGLAATDMTQVNKQGLPQAIEYIQKVAA